MNSDDHQVIKNIVSKFGNVLDSLSSPLRMSQRFKSQFSSAQSLRSHREIIQKQSNQNNFIDEEEYNKRQQVLFNKTGEIEKLRQSQQSFFYPFSDIKRDNKSQICDNLKFSRNSKTSLIRDINSRNEESIKEILVKRERSQMSKNVKIISPIVVVKNKNLKIIPLSDLNDDNQNNSDNKQIQNIFSSRKSQYQISKQPIIDPNQNNENPQLQIIKLSIASIEPIESKNLNQLIPPMRVGIAQTVYNNRWYLYGGHSEYNVNDIFVYSIEDNKWEIKYSNGQIKAQRNRSNHSAVLIQNSIYYFGGNFLFNRQLKRRECVNETLLYHIDTNKWELVQTENDVEVQPRRNHAAVGIKDKYILISGGLNTEDKAISDICLLNLETLKWNVIQLDNCELSDHTIINVTNNKAQLSQAIFNDQILCFGGKNNLNQSNNLLRILEYSKTDGMPTQWTILKTLGNKPCPRHAHIAKIDRIFFTLIIAGGCDNGIIFDDIWSLALNKMTWTQIEIRKGRIQRFGAISTFYSQKVLVFGGIEAKGYSNSDILQIEISEIVIKKKNVNVLDKYQMKKHSSLFIPTQIQL